MDSKVDPESGTAMYSLLPTGTCVAIVMAAGVTASDTFCSAATSSRGPPAPRLAGAPTAAMKTMAPRTTTMMATTGMARVTGAPVGSAGMGRGVGPCAIWGAPQKRHVTSPPGSAGGYRIPPQFVHFATMRLSLLYPGSGARLEAKPRRGPPGSRKGRKVCTVTRGLWSLAAGAQSGILPGAPSPRRSHDG